jgi:hypothetical protein
MAKTKGAFARKSVVGNRDKVIRFRCTQQTFDLIKEMAGLEQLNISDFCLQCIKQFPRFSYRIHGNVEYTKLDDILELNHARQPRPKN